MEPCALRFDRDTVSAAALIAEVASRCRVRDLTLEEPEIEEVVRRIYQGEPAIGSVAEPV